MGRAPRRRRGDAAAAVELREEPWLAAISVPYSLCERGADALLTRAAGKVAVLARRPLAGGALAGALGPGVALARLDDRRTLDEPALERRAVIAARLAPLVSHEPAAARSCDAARAVLERGRRPPHVEAGTAAALALRFVVDRGAIALPRLHRAEHVAEAIACAAAPPLSAGLHARLDELMRDT